MASLKIKGDLAELKVATDLLERGYKIAIPYGEDWDFDLIFSRADGLERVQVKHASSNGAFITVKCFSHSLTKGRVRTTKLYTAAMIDWLAVYDPTTDRCYYIPAAELADGRRQLILRLTPPRNNQRAWDSVCLRLPGPRSTPAIVRRGMGEREFQPVPRRFLRWGSRNFSPVGERGSSKQLLRWSQRDSNPRPRGCKPRALPTELWPQGVNSRSRRHGCGMRARRLPPQVESALRGARLCEDEPARSDSGGWDGKDGDRDRR